jgi:uncharacterized repeat protein (TIGR03803 family)
MKPMLESGFTLTELPFLVPVLVAVLGSVLAGQVSAQTLTTLYNFTGATNEGYAAKGNFILSGNTLYGISQYFAGALFKLNIDGTGFTVLHSFTGSDGATPTGFIIDGDTLYGTASAGGDFGSGTLFKLNVDGTGFSTLHSFTSLPPNGIETNSDGAGPTGGLVLSSGTLYGTAGSGGSFANGTLFKVNVDGSGFTILHSFTTLLAISGDVDYRTNSDGAFPMKLVLSDSTLYGVTGAGGSWDEGTIFKIKTDGTGFTTLYNFGGFYGTNNYRTGGASGLALLLSGDTLYGSGRGPRDGVFKIKTDGTGFTILHSFSDNDDGDGGGAINLILSGSTLYGTAETRGLFRMNADGTGFTELYSFTGLVGLALATDTFYGTWDGGLGYGIIFSISFTPQLTIFPSGSNIILTWPTNYAGFDYGGYTLQSTTNLPSPVWTTNPTNLPAPVVVNGQYTVTNPVSGMQQFFRLSQ